jgi:hypothetical protein
VSKPDTTTEPEAVPETADVSDVIRTGNKVEPTTTQRTTPPKRRGGLGVFGQVAEAIAKSLAAVTVPAAAGGADEGPAAKPARVEDRHQLPHQNNCRSRQRTEDSR